MKAIAIGGYGAPPSVPDLAVPARRRPSGAH